ncbi:DUF1707 domain-containing protein [Streptomyces sp. NPDC088812]|uniref:DUF1707 SHOCT-like domain-containing protein n=1 Tax=Streptomyces sp. NPDC088812 TaxID=3365905 RepID=UPI0038190ECB
MDLQKRTAPRAPGADPRASVAELRASDADRDRIADILREALAEGRLTADEHAERVEGVLAARTVGELDGFIRDLPAAHHRHAPPYTPAPHRPPPGALPADPDDNLVAVFSSSVRRGRWRVGRRIHAYAVFGSVEIDLSEALFEYRHVVVKAFSVFGNVEVRVPENVSLFGTGGGVLGTFEVDTLDSADPDAPVVHVEGWAVLGHIEGRPRRGRVVADILDKVHRAVDRSVRRHLDR